MKPITVGEAIELLTQAVKTGQVEATSPLLIGLPEGFSIAESGVTGFSRVDFDGTGAFGLVVEPKQDESGNGGGESEFDFDKETNTYFLK